jgi:proline dehydrogenase
MGIINKAISQILPFIPTPIIGYFARPYIAGDRLDEAVRTVKELMAEGACATVDVLGEEVTSEEQTLHAVEIYKQVLQRINSERLDSNISLKPTHMGLKLDKEFCYNNIRSLVESARIYNNFIRIDMEDHTTTTDTLQIYSRLREEFDNVGTVLQSSMRRTVSDINKLIPLRPNLRICKGIYVEPYFVAYKDKQIINQNFAYTIEKLFLNNCYIGIATHDEKVVWEALRVIDKYNIPGNKYEFQMLLGVEPNLRRVLIKAGHRLRVYVPFGAEWAKYSTRRLKENPDIVGHVMRKLFFQMFNNQQK